MIRWTKSTAACSRSFEILNKVNAKYVYLQSYDDYNAIYTDVIGICARVQRVLGTHRSACCCECRSLGMCICICGDVHTHAHTCAVNYGGAFCTRHCLGYD